MDASIRKPAGGTRDQDNEVLRQIYEAAWRPGGWQDAMRAVGERVGATSAYLFSAPDLTSPAGINEVLGMSARMVQEHVQWHHEDPWMLGAIRAGKMHRGALVFGDELLPHDAFLKTAFYNDFLRQHEMARMLGSVVSDGHEVDGSPFTNLCWYRPAGHAAFDEDAKAVIREFLPHFQEALRLRRQVRAVSGAGASSALSDLHIACIFLDAEQRLVQANEAGVALMESSARGAIRHGKVHHVGAACAPGLAEAQRQCAGGAATRLLVRLAGAGGEVVGATMVAMPESQNALTADARARFLLMVELPLSDGEELTARVAELFKLSPAETRILSELLSGVAPNDIAKKLEVGLPTVRTHIQGIFKKTGVTRQIDLVRMLRGVRL